MTNVVDYAGLLSAPKVSVNGSPLAAEDFEQLVDCRVHLAFGRPGQVVLRFSDDRFSLADDSRFVIGSEVTVQLAPPGQANAYQQVFKGKITARGIEARASTDRVFTVTVHDGAFKIGRNSTAKVSADQTYSDVVSTIGKAAGLRVSCPQLPRPQRHLMQLVDDAAMLDHVCAVTGYVWYVADGTLTLARPALTTPAIELTLGTSLESFRTHQAASDMAQTVTVRSWDRKSKSEIVGTSEGTPPAMSSAPDVAAGRSKAGDAFPSRRTTMLRHPQGPDEAKDAAKALLANSMADELIARGVAVGNPKIALASTVKVTGVGASLSGNYYVSEVEHVFTRHGFTTRFVSGTQRPATLVDVLGQKPAPQWHERGPVIGVVSAVEDGDGVRGTVKVKLPVAGEGVVTTWARVVSVGAGPKRGLMAIPSVGDEVLVVFEHGDLSRPVVIGGLWNTKDEIPQRVEHDRGLVTEWTLTSVDGHTITIRKEDTATKPAFQIALKDTDIRLLLSSQKVELLGKANKPLEIKAGSASITFTEKGDVEIKGNNVKIQATQNMEMEAIDLKATGKMSLVLKGTSSAELGGLNVKVDGSAMTEIKGGMVRIN